MMINKTFYIKFIAVVAAFVPLAWLVYLISTNQLGADPAKDIQHFIGTTALNFVLFTLMLSPLVHVLRLTFFNKLRRIIGLSAFCWATLHLLSYYVLELAGDFSFFYDEITTRTYLTVGAFAWFGLFLLAITSNQLSMKKLGKKWKQLHNVVYPIAILCAIHYYLALKVKTGLPIIYMIVFVILWAYHCFRQHKLFFKRLVQR